MNLVGSTVSLCSVFYQNVIEAQCLYCDVIYTAQNQSSIIYTFLKEHIVRFQQLWLYLIEVLCRE